MFTDYENLPPPPVPKGANMQNYTWFPDHPIEWRQSKAWLSCKKNPAAGFYMVNLHRASWHGVPAGSIEDDDDILADAAMCSPDEWPKFKVAALAGFTLHNDRRWYSNYLVPKVLAALDQKAAQAARTRNATEARKRLRESPAPTSSIKDDSADANVRSTSHDRDEDATSPSTSPEEKREEEKKDSDAAHRPGVPPVAARKVVNIQCQSSFLAAQAPSPPDVRTALFREGLRTLIAITGRSESSLRSYLSKALKELKDDAAVMLSIIRDCATVERADPLGWITKAVKERAMPKSTLQERLQKAAGLSAPSGIATIIIDHEDFEDAHEQTNRLV
jgi:uncharacterized protein YdaU (DUF1376 family)